MSENNIYILKGRFKATTTNTFGLFAVFVDKTQKNIDKISVAVSHFSSIYETNPELDWYKFDQIIQMANYKGEVSQSLTSDFQSLFRNSFGPEVIETFIDSVEGKNLKKVENIFVSLISKILADKEVTIQVEKQALNRQEMERIKSEAENAASKNEEKKSEEKKEETSTVIFNVEEGSVILNVEVVIGPIGGIPIYEVKPLDQIYVKIPGRTPKEMSFINLLNARNETGEILPVPATVKEVVKDKDTKQVNLLVEIVPGVYGKAMEQETVKLKKYDPLNDPRIKKTSTENPAQQPNIFSYGTGRTDKQTSPLIFLWIIGAVILILGLLFIFFASGG